MPSKTWRNIFWWTKVFSGAALEVGCSKSGQISPFTQTKSRSLCRFWVGFQETSWNNVDFYFFFWRCSARQNHPNNTQSDRCQKLGKEDLLSEFPMDFQVFSRKKVWNSGQLGTGTSTGHWKPPIPTITVPWRIHTYGLLNGSMNGWVIFLWWNVGKKYYYLDILDSCVG